MASSCSPSSATGLSNCMITDPNLLHCSMFLLQDLDSYLKNRSPVSFLSELRDNLLLANSGGAAAAAAGGDRSGDQPGNRSVRRQSEWMSAIYTQFDL